MSRSNLAKQDIIDAVKETVPRMIKEALQETVPGMIQASIQHMVPVMIKEAIRENIPGMIRSEIRETVPGMIRNGIQETVPSMIRVGNEDVLDVVYVFMDQVDDRFGHLEARLDGYALRIDKAEAEIDYHGRLLARVKAAN